VTLNSHSLHHLSAGMLGVHRIMESHVIAKHAERGKQLMMMSDSILILMMLSLNQLEEEIGGQNDLIFA